MQQEQKKNSLLLLAETLVSSIDNLKLDSKQRKVDCLSDDKRSAVITVIDTTIVSESSQIQLQSVSTLTIPIINIQVLHNYLCLNT